MDWGREGLAPGIEGLVFLVAPLSLQTALPNIVATGCVPLFKFTFKLTK